MFSFLATRNPGAAGLCFSRRWNLIRLRRRQCGQLVRGVAAVEHGLVGHDAAVAEADEPRSVLGDVVLVRDEQDGDAALLVQALEDAHDLDAGARVEVAGGFVGQDDRRLVDQRAGDGDALLLAAGELVRHVVIALAEPDRVERRQRALVPLGGLEAVLRAVEQRQLDVVERGRARQQVEALEHEADLLVAHARQLVLRRLGHVLAVEHVLTGRRPIEAAGDVHERRLAGAGRPGDGDELALLDVERHAAQRAHDVFAHSIFFGEIPHRNNWHLGDSVL